MSSAEIRFGIIGAGVAGRYHAQAIVQTPGARLVAVCAGRPERAAALAEAFGASVEPNAEALLARNDIDAVCICTPSGQHAAQGIAAAHAGKHVLVEKPIAITLADADALIDACRAAGVHLGVALQRRTDPEFRAARDAIAAGALGRMVLGAITIPYLRTQAYYDSADWRGTWALDGGGALMNQGIHLLDLLLWLMDDDVVEVQAYTTTLARAIEVEDCVSAALRFAGGALGSIAATTAVAPGFPHRVEVYGTHGGLQIEGEAIVRWETADESTVSAPRIATGGAGRQEAGAGALPTGISALGHTRILHDFVAAIRDRRAPLVTGEEARRALSVALAVYESARTGRAARPKMGGRPA
ncbi:Gfo/Idh/MocA family protein [Roseiflexus castenholzii]|uniref:Oxidoreductase domain protein n=2 Tax=Chloroflexota TaxID=200795 RepID=A7NLB2_ROSCS|nr:Gfo/Idh/MocA family oxidoreductase [Roseiflexus castenholzii]ABU58285.1 oxidoreductase domain protein [Roseiflexus castenholzii DSM 13941]